MKIPINKPSITDLEKEYVNDAIAEGWGPKCYEYLFAFEAEFSKHLGSRFSHCTSSCTGAIHLALLALGLKAGDEVIVPDITWIASIEPILYIGAKPVFVDISEDNWCINPESVKQAITKKTKGIIAVHLYGNMPDMNSLVTLARDNGLFLLEDAAEAIGSQFDGKKAGSIGDIGVFSFHGTKTISSGEGGMICTDSEELNDRVRVLNDHGRNSKDPDHKMFWMRNYGYKYKMSNLQAAMGYAQIRRVESLIERKREIFNQYKLVLKPIESLIKMNPETSLTKNGYWLPTVVVDKLISFDRQAYFNFMSDNDIDSRPFFYPLSTLPMFSTKKSNVVAYSIYNRAVNLPSFHDMTNEQVQYVGEKFIDFFNKNDL